MGTVFQISYELLENYKRFSAVSAEKKMQAICTKDFKGFLSIGDDSALYHTQEATGGSAVWERDRLCEPLRKLHAKAKNFTVRTFAATQDPVSGKYVLITAVIVDGKDYIYLSQSDTMSVLSWKEVPINKDMRDHFTVYDLNLSSYRDDLSLIASMKEKNGNIERFFINSDEKLGDLWRFYPLPANFDVITWMCPGRAGGQRVDGIYTLGSIAGSAQLMYMPSYNVYDPEIAPTSTRLKVLSEIDTIATCPVDNKPFTNLFACGGGKLYLYQWDRQDDLSHPVEVASSPFFNDVTQLFAFTSRGRVYVWALNESKQLVYIHASVEGIASKSNWSPMLMMHDNLNYVYPFKDSADSTNAMFGYLTNDMGIIGRESAETGLWSFDEISIEAPDEKPTSFVSYTTKIIVSDAKGNLLPGQKVLLKASEHCGVFINGISYYFKDNPIEVTANPNGEIKIIQKATSPAAVKFRVWERNGIVSDIDPSDNVMEKAYNLNTKDKLKNAKIVSQSGDSKPLVAPGTNDATMNAVAEAIGTLKKAKAQIDREKVLKSGNLLSKSEINAFSASMTHGIRLSFNGDAVITQTVPTTFRNLCDFTASLETGESSNGLGYMNIVSFNPADVFNFLKGLAGKIFDVFINVVDGAWNFIVKIGETIMSFVIDCVEKVVACVVEVFNWIKVTIEKIIEFLKFVFDMDDIIQTKDVMKKLINICMDDAKKELGKLKQEAFACFDDLIHAVEEFGDLGDLGELGKKNPSQLKSQGSKNCATDVRSGYLSDLVLENYNPASGENMFSASNEAISNAALDELENLIDYLKTAFDEDKRIIDDAIARIQNEFIKDNAIMNMDLLTILKKLFAILSVSMLEITRQVVGIFIDLAIKAFDLLQEFLNEDIYIPIVSEFLDLIGVGRFSMLDVVCFCVSFMANFSYKLITQKKLLDDASYKAIMRITTLSDLRKLSPVQAENMHGISISNTSKTVFVLFKVLAGIAACFEAAVSAIFKFNPETQDNKLIMVCNFADGVSYVVASFAFSPMKDKVPLLKYSLIFTSIKYLPYAGIGLGFILHVKGKKEASKKAMLVGKGFYAVTSLLTIIIDIIYLAQGCAFPYDKERELFNIDYSSLIFDNLRNVLDFVLCPEITKDPYVRAGVLIGRTVAATVYGIMQIAEGIDCVSIDSVSGTTPAMIPETV